jgi:hypothetical protein
MVDAVVEVLCGAHPTSFFPAYGYDERFHQAWTKVSRDDGRAAAFIERFVHALASQAEYLEAAGGAGMLKRIRAWEATQG